MKKDTTKELGKVTRIDGTEICGYQEMMFKGTFVDILNALLEAEADKICYSNRQEHSPGVRIDTRFEHYKRKGQSSLH